MLPAPDRGSACLLGIDGRSGSGKSTLAEEVSRALQTAGRAVSVLSMDELYSGWHGLAAVGSVLCRDVIAPLRARLEADVHPYDWEREHFDAPRRLQVEDVLVIEGVGATVHGCRDELDLTVWVQAPQDLRIARALHRTGQGDFASHATAWQAQERALFGPDSYPQPPPNYDYVVHHVAEGSPR